jgi:glycosyltransferase involved in cell wall biosynthesis
VSSFHNELLAPGWKGQVFKLYNRTVTRAAVRRSAQLTVLSLDHARTVPVLAAELGRRPGAFRPVPNGVDVAMFTPGDATAIRQRLGFAADDVVAIVCTKLDDAHYFKRLDLALRAIAETADSRLRLLVLGGGELLNRFAEQAADLGIKNRVVFVGDQPHDAVVDFYRTSDFLLLTSDSVESFAIVQTEAMACGKPVVVSALPGVREVSHDGVHGLHFAPGSLDDLKRKLAVILEMSTEQRATMGAAGRKHVADHYRWARTAELLEAAYRAAIAGRPAR